MTKLNTYYTAGGTINPEQALYIQRAADDELLRYCQAREFAYVLSTRQMGKSSLMVKTAQTLQAEGFVTFIVDLSYIGTNVEAEAWYLGFLVALENEHTLDIDVIEWWLAHAQLGYVQRLTEFFKTVLLTHISRPIVIFVDEIDTTLPLPFTDDFFAAIRAVYNQRTTISDLQRLTFILIGVATPTELMKDPDRTPFNIGQRIDLTDFTFKEARPFIAGLGIPNRRESLEVLAWVFNWTNGHPYLTQRLLAELAQREQPVWSQHQIDRVVQQLFLAKTDKQDNNLKFVHNWITNRTQEADLPKVIRYYRSIYQGIAIQDKEQSQALAHLKLSGLIKTEANILSVRNKIYATVFDLDWIAEVEQSRQLADPVELAQLRKIADEQQLRAKAEAQRAKEQKLLLRFEAQRAEERQKASAKLRSRTIGFVLLVLTVLVGGIIARNAAKQSAVQETITRIEAVLPQSVQNTIQAEATRSAQAEEATPTETNIASNAELLATNRRATAQAQAPRIATTSKETDNSLELFLTSPQSINVAAHNDDIRSVAFDNQLLASGSEDFTVKLWDMSNRHVPQLLNQFAPTNSAVLSLAFQPQGQQLAVGNGNGNITLWNVINPINPTLRYTLAAHSGSVMSLTYTRQTLVSAGEDAAIKLWDVTNSVTPKLTSSLNDHSGIVYSVAVSPEGTTLASGSGDTTLKLWDINNPANPQFLNSLTDHTDSVYTVAFSPDGQILASGGADQTVRLWDVSNPTNPQQLTPPLVGPSEIVYAIAFSPDGNILASGNSDNTIILWDISGRHPPQQLTPPLSGHSQLVSSVAFQNNNTLVSGSRDNTLMVWNLTE